MNPVNSISSLLEVLRKRATDAVFTRPLKGKGRAGITQQNPSDTLESVRQQVLEALNGISPEEPSRQQKAMRVFVEKILLWRFGQELVADPAFRRLVDELAVEMLDEPVVREALEGLCDVKDELP